MTIRAKCPRCGEGKLFDGFLTVAKDCSRCGLDYVEFNTGDGAAMFIILIAGFVIIGAVLYVEVSYQPPYWVHAAIWLPVTILLPLMLMRPFKSWLIAQQYKHKAREGRLDT